MRLTKIICTLGPASSTPETLRALADNGMDVARINFSHGQREDQLKFLKLVKDLNAERKSAVALLLDTKGCEIRTGDRKEPLPVKVGDEIVFSPFPPPNEKRPVIHVNYDGFAGDVAETDRILIDNGEMVFDIVSIDPSGFVVARAKDDGKIGSRRHINLPGADIDLPSITPKDWEDIAFGIEQDMDMVALSFIRTAEDVMEVKSFLKDKGSPMLVFAKIETKQAVERIDDIIAVSDGIMIARGDLGAEIPYERIPAIQGKIVRGCQELGKPVIVATHMLESMTQHPMPTRAEVTDVAHAAMSRTDCTMLSGETASGKHPALAVEAMARIIRETEAHLEPDDAVRASPDEVDARAEAAVRMANAIGAPAIVALTRSGWTAKAISRFRPSMPTLAAAPDEAVRRRMQVLYGVHSTCIPFNADPEVTTRDAIAAFVKLGKLRPGDRIVLLADTLAGGHSVDTVQIRTVS